MEGGGRGWRAGGQGVQGQRQGRKDKKVSKLDDRGREVGGDDNDRGLFMLAALLTKLKFKAFLF